MTMMTNNQRNAATAIAVPPVAVAPSIENLFSDSDDSESESLSSVQSDDSGPTIRAKVARKKKKREQREANLVNQDKSLRKKSKK